MNEEFELQKTLYQVKKNLGLLTRKEKKLAKKYEDEIFKSLNCDKHHSHTKDCLN